MAQFSCSDVFGGAVRDLYYDQRIINVLIPDVQGEKMKNPNAEWIYFDVEKDVLLNHRLDFTNPISHCIIYPNGSHLQSVGKTYDPKVRLRDQRLKDVMVSKHLDDINNLHPNAPIGPASLNKQFILDVNDDKYYLDAS